VDIYEASSRVGGRVQTDDLEGFKLDHGFQILLDAYPEVRRNLDLKALKLRGFGQGAVLADKGKLSIVANPLTCPRNVFQTVRTAAGWGPLTSCMDITRLLGIAVGWICSSPYKALDNKERPEPTDAMLQRMRLSPAMVQKFLRPFFEAIYVSPLSQQSSALFNFVLRMLAIGGAVLPEDGMRAIPEQLAASLQRPVHLSTLVQAVRSDGVLVNDIWTPYDAVVVAADWPGAKRLLKGLPSPNGTRSATWYFALPGPPPVTEPLIILQSYSLTRVPAEENAPSRISNIGFPSSVQQSYAPEGKSLAAVTIMGAAVEESWVRSEVESMLGVDCSGWRHLRTYDICFHQPAQVPTRKAKMCSLEIDGVYCCGDHRAYPTMDGAMLSGRLVADALMPGARERAQERVA